MNRLKYFYRLALPALILAFLTFYAEQFQDDDKLPLAISLTLTFLCGFLAPQGK